MISVQNLRLLSNGNKILALLGLIWWLDSCTIMKNSTAERVPSKVYYPEVQQDTAGVSKQQVDTLVWSEKNEDKNEAEEIKIVKKQDQKKSEINLNKKDKYRIDILIPLNSYSVFGSLKDLEESNTYPMVQYYSGMIMALVDLKQKGANFDVNVIDAPTDGDITKSYINGAKNAKPDVIIGPNEKNQLKNILEFAKENQILVIPPWKAISNLTTENKYYIQVKPTLESYYQKMVQNVDSSGDASNVFIISMPDAQSKSRADNISEQHLKNSPSQPAYKNISIDEFKMATDEPVFGKIFTGTNTTKCIILPNWSFKDEDYVFNCLRKINIEKGSYPVRVYGLPLLMNSDKLNYDLFKRLNIRVVSPIFIDENDEKVKIFKKDFYDQFNVFPTDDAFEGYDMMTFLGSNLLNLGVNFAPEIDSNKQDYISTTYNIKSNFRKADADHTTDYFDFYENKNLFIIGFMNNKFVKL